MRLNFEFRDFELETFMLLLFDDVKVGLNFQIPKNFVSSY